MSIESEINRISTNVSDTLAAIEEMGGEVPEGATSNDMASAARSIPVGAKIDDSAPATDKTYSSSKIDSLLNEQKEAIDDKLDASALPTAINTALAQAKESGQFDGAQGPKGDKGDDGRGIISIQQTSGDHSPGTRDTYTIYYTDGTSRQYTVYNGQDGKTPVKGTDYWTAADKQGIVSDVLAALPTWEGGSY